MRINESKGSVAGWSKAMKGLQKIDSETKASLNAALGVAFAKTQINVHVISGNLKKSGRQSGDVTGNIWTGTIAYGGSGTKAPYAVYEQRRKGVRAGWSPHPPHDFFAGLDEVATNPIEKAIDTHFWEL